MLSASTLASDYLAGVAASDSTTLAVLGRALVRVESLVAVHLGYPGTSPTLASTSYTLRLKGLRQQPKRLLLTVGPVTAIASVHQDADQAFGASSIVSSSEYETEDHPGGSYLILLPTASVGKWLPVDRSIKVTCTAGYANEAAMPPALSDAIYRIVADWWLRRANRHLGSISAGRQNQSILDLKDASPDAMAVLAQFRLLGDVGF